MINLTAIARSPNSDRTQSLSSWEKMQKIQGKFYPLQHEEWMRACKEALHNHGMILIS
ncbi:hypothetical protein [Pleurocapsa sp. PCC 7327]|uniref:hypothetical protein n=1 Tax=Pleurocapsa sp. PCC 7327 TaxID=118163 RepID=UPI0002EA7431|nr:hypothetical protein [Pleurocapsa sp. PCC 7327]